MKPSRTWVPGAVLVLLVAGAGAQAPCPNERLAAVPGPDFSRYGTRVRASGERLLVTSQELVFRFQDPTGFHFGAVHLHVLQGGEWVEEAKLTLAESTLADAFAFSADLQGELAAVGAPGACALDCIPGTLPGRVLLFERGPNGWEPAGELAPADGHSGDVFGFSVAVDGDRIVAGAPLHAGAGTESGAAYVFERLGGSWVQTARLASPSPADGERFGEVVAVRGDRIAVSAVGDLGVTPSLGERGAVHVFELAGGAWVHRVALRSPMGSEQEVFGADVALGDGRLLVGSPGASIGRDPALFAEIPEAFSHGAAFLHEPASGGWELAATWIAGRPEPGALFGAAVDLDGDRAVVGAPGASEAGPFSGAAHLFERTALGWAERARLAGPPGGGPASSPAFGRSVALGELVVAVGAPLEDGDGPDEGAVHVFGQDPSCAGQELLATPGLLSVADPAAHVLGLRFGPALAGRTYVVLGSATGTSPSLVVAGIEIPLVLDDYSIDSWTLANGSIFVNTFGTLDAAGEATAALVLPPLAPALVGRTLFHAAIVIAPGGVVVASSPASRVRLVP